MVYQCTTVLSQMCKLPNQIITISELWTRAYKAELNEHRWMSPSPFTTKIQGLTKIHYTHSWWLFWYMMSKVFLQVILFHRLKLWIYCFTSFLVVPLGMSTQDWLKLPSSYMIMLPTCHTLSRMFCVIRGWKCYYIPLYYQAQSVWLLISFPNQSSYCVGNDLQMDRMF
jgi:hypothetical protein